MAILTTFTCCVVERYCLNLRLQTRHQAQLMNPNLKLQDGRIHYLDSIRGIAALMVVVYHYIGWRWSDTLEFKLAAFVFNGNDAVSFFFVLSGFVLSFSYIHTDRKVAFGRYLYKRILRLYPAFILNIVLLFCYHKRKAPISDTLSAVFVDNAHPRLWKELGMIFNAHDLYLPGWTLQIEMIYSLLIIPLILIFRRQKHLLWAILIGSYFIGSVDMRIYMTHFILGIGLAAIYPSLKTQTFKESKLYPWRWPMALLIFTLFSFRNLAKFVQPINELFHFFWKINIRWEHFSGIAAFLMLVVVIMHKPSQRFLLKPVLLYLGKISYSIYLIHWLLVIFIMDYWDTWAKVLGSGALRFWGMLILFLAATIALASLMYRYVEAPCIKLSKHTFKSKAS